jgi:hypothetical protein
MPLSKHYDGKGEEVMASMRRTYGDDAERVFYATENKARKRTRKKAQLRALRRRRR